MNTVATPLAKRWQLRVGAVLIVALWAVAISANAVSVAVSRAPLVCHAGNPALERSFGSTCRRLTTNS